MKKLHNQLREITNSQPSVGGSSRIAPQEKHHVRHTAIPKNHARFDPPFHYFLVPVLLLNLIFTIIYFLRHHDMRAGGLVHGWMVVMAFAFIIMAFKLRINALVVQDRVIRLEEKLRLQSLSVPATTIEKLNLGQLIALRFASDAELPGLAARAVTEDLSRKQIKELITHWRPDTLRV